MDKSALKQYAIDLELEIDRAANNGVADALKFKSYLKEEKELAKSQKINKPIEVNTHGAWRYWFSETELGGCNAIQNAFVNFTNCLSGKDEDPSYQELLKKVSEITKNS